MPVLKKLKMWYFSFCTDSNYSNTSARCTIGLNLGERDTLKYNRVTAYLYRKRSTPDIEMLRPW